MLDRKAPSRRSVAYPAREPVRRGPVVLPPEAVPAWVHPVSRTYLASRNLSQQEVEDYGLLFCDGGAWRQRIIIPMYDRHDTLIAFQGRSIDPAYRGLARYRTEGPRPVYIPWDPLHVSGDAFCLCEGPFDVFAVMRVMPAAAILGNQVSEFQRAMIHDLIQRYGFTSMFIWLDADAVTLAGVLRMQFAPYLPTTLIFWEHAKDPGELSRDEIRHVLSAST